MYKLHQVGSVFAGHSWTLGLFTHTRGKPAIASKSNNRGAQPTNCDRVPDSPECAEFPEAKPTHAMASGRNGLDLDLDIYMKQNETCHHEEFDEDLFFGEDLFSEDSATSGDGDGDHDNHLLNLLEAQEDNMVALAIDGVVDLLDDEDLHSAQTHTHLHTHRVVPGVLARDAAAAVFRELQMIRAAAAPINVQASVLPIPMPPPRVQMPVMTSTLTSRALMTAPVGAMSCTDNVPLQKTSVAKHNKRKAPKAKKERWTPEETALLKEGVELFGVGQWLKIKKHFGQHLQNRSNVDLKDRWRNFGGQRQSQQRRNRSPPTLHDADVGMGGSLAKRAKMTPMVC